MTAGVLAASLCAGCANLAGPNWSDPGTAPEQRLRAQIFDPYPENEAGPEIIGSRPRDYDRGVPEVERARRLSRRLGW
ncbi:MAG TPA: hypothetical protein EYP56_20540 [Planctomycetaceae bacterium]|nr:hypothetical protein [Planctomycetaceae bacterium]HIQ20479.1 hypothetical protein [Planctomycetota bacterium]